MKKFYFSLIAVLLVIVGVNIYFYYYFYNQQVAFHTDILEKQVEICTWEIERSGYDFENEINYIVFSTDIANFFDSEEKKELRIRKLELFYFKYQKLIKNIKIIDNNKNVFSLFKDKTNHFITDYYLAQKQKELNDREEVSLNPDGSYNYILPVFSENRTVANIIIKIDINDYLKQIFENYHLGNTVWQWTIDSEGKLLNNNLSRDSVFITQTDKIFNDIQNETKGTVKNEVIYNGTRSNLISVYHPVRILSKDFGVGFSLETRIVIGSIIRKIILVSVLTIFIFLILIGILLYLIFKKNTAESQIRKSEAAFKEILESLPIGIMMLDTERMVRSINKTAIKTFSLEKESDIVGQSLSDQFLISRNFQDKDSFSYTDNLNQYIYYDDNDNEIIIYKKEVKYHVANEEYSLEAFIDITPIENARKREIAANKAKSEFLAKMSHEIRTPLNGIIGMADALGGTNLTDKQAEAVHIIKKSADLLLSIINDILDFSKIEAGKMVIEETPFNLREEVESTVSLFRLRAEDKGIELVQNIKSNVPDQLIGDPFRLRQVISNLIGNSIKFTIEGKILVNVEMVKNQSGRVVIQFDIEDTGIGIPHEKLKEIFSSFSQADGSTTRKFGGTGLGTTISKQLVELMGGKIWVESPSSISTNPQYSGSKFSFTIEVYSNEKIKKDLDFSHISDYDEINVLIINNNPDEDKILLHTFKSFDTNNTEITPEVDVIGRIERGLKPGDKQLHLLVINDSAEFDGIGLARKIYEKGLSSKMLIMIVSSNDQPGNYVKCKMNGVDYYLIKPYEASEVYEVLIENFTSLKVTDKELPDLNKLKKSIKILVAEDNIINQKVAQTIFKNLGYEIVLAQNGKDCVKKVKEGSYDIIFMDIMMPEQDGLEATAEIRSLGFKTPIVAMTANAREEDKMKAIDSGMNYYLAKPVRIEEIKEVLIKWFSE
jgi:signal transduction histidine kinase/DNA-binding response OmpR family regulator